MTRGNSSTIHDSKGKKFKILTARIPEKLYQKVCEEAGRRYEGNKTLLVVSALQKYFK